MSLRIDMLTLFPEMFTPILGTSIPRRAAEKGLVDYHLTNIRDFATDAHKSVDDKPFGGGPGMVMMVDPLRRALDAVRAAGGPDKAIYLSPQGARLTQRKVEELARREKLFLLCGRYEGIDERFLEHAVDEEISIGDYVISGGELAAAIVIDAIGRLQEGALNDAQSAEQDSFSNGLLDCPHYTRPERDAWGDVPPVLLSGDHAAIRRWRLKQSLGRTWLRRPDLLAHVAADKEMRALLDEFRREHRDATQAREDKPDRPRDPTDKN